MCFFFFFAVGLHFLNVNITLEYTSLYARPCAQSKVIQYDDPEFRQDHLGGTAPQRAMSHLKVKVIQK